VSQEQICPVCGKPCYATVPQTYHPNPSACDKCRMNYCIEHGMDRRDPKHPAYCQPGEW
jgi:hypothetical protein